MFYLSQFKRHSLVPRFDSKVLYICVHTSSSFSKGIRAYSCKTHGDRSPWGSNSGRNDVLLSWL